MRAPLDSPMPQVAALEGVEGRLVVVTGARGAGKTTWCEALVREARTLGLHTAGLLSPHVVEDGIRVAIDLVDVVTGERRRLATRPDPRFPPPDARRGARWVLDHDTLAWGNAILGRVNRADLLVLDEIGALELRHGTGLVAGLRLLRDRRYGTACAVVRPDLVEEARRRWPWAQTLRVGDAE